MVSSLSQGGPSLPPPRPVQTAATKTCCCLLSSFPSVAYSTPTVPIVGQLGSGGLPPEGLCHRLQQNKTQSATNAATRPHEPPRTMHGDKPDAGRLIPSCSTRVLQPGSISRLAGECRVTCWPVRSQACRGCRKGRSRAEAETPPCKPSYSPILHVGSRGSYTVWPLPVCRATAAHSLSPSYVPSDTSVSETRGG